MFNELNVEARRKVGWAGLKNENSRKPSVSQQAAMKPGHLDRCDQGYS